MPRLGALAAIDRYVDGLVHMSVAGDPLEAPRHRAFIAVNLVGGLVALGLLPLYLLAVGHIGLVEAVALVALAAPAPIALFVSHTGRLDFGHCLSALATCALVTWVAAFTGGQNSAVLIGLAVLPLEAAISGQRSMVKVALALAVAGALIILFAGRAGLLPPSALGGGQAEALGAFVPAVAIFYAGLLALRIEAIHDASARAARSRGLHFRLVAENITDIVSSHAANGDIVFVTSAVERVLGLPIASALGEGLFHRIHVADRPAYLTAISDAVVHGKASEVEFRVKVDGSTPHGRHVWLEMRCRPIGEIEPATDGAVVVAVTRDITERKRQQEEVLQARELAEAASRAKTRFLANVSHELRTPLNAIIGFSDMLQTETCGQIGDERQREYVHLIHESGTHLLQVVNDILDMSKIESGAFDVVPEPFEVGKLVDSVRQMMGHQAEERGLKLSTSIGAALPELMADRRACKQILINLVSNALKFTDRGGSVVVGTRRDGDAVEFYVRDTGIGIREADIRRLGTPFVQADSGYDRRHEGAGLGLSVVKGLAALHGGAMKIESRLGEGTCVTVRLPIAGDKRADGTVVPLPAVTEPSEVRKRA